MKCTQTVSSSLMVAGFSVTVGSPQWKPAGASGIPVSVTSQTEPAGMSSMVTEPGVRERDGHVERAAIAAVGVEREVAAGLAAVDFLLDLEVALAAARRGVVVGRTVVAVVQFSEFDLLEEIARAITH